MMVVRSRARSPFRHPQPFAVRGGERAEVGTPAPPIGMGVELREIGQGGTVVGVGRGDHVVDAVLVGSGNRRARQSSRGQVCAKPRDEGILLVPRDVAALLVVKALPVAG